MIFFVNMFFTLITIITKSGQKKEVTQRTDIYHKVVIILVLNIDFI